MKKIFKKVAKQFRTSPENVHQEIQAMIDEAWSNPEGREMQQKLFPEGKPTPELFLQRVVSELKQNSPTTV